MHYYVKRGGVNAQYKNPPTYHETLGDLDDPIEIHPNYNGTIWEIHNLTGCAITVELWMTYQYLGGTALLNTQISVGANSVSSFTHGQFLSLIGTQYPNSGQITELSSFVIFNGINMGGWDGFYPYQSKTIVTTQPPPCDCFKWVPDINNGRVYLEPCP